MDLDHDLKDLPKVAFRPELMVGAVSPLWGYFGAAAMGGMAMWWMSRWMKPDNLEAMFDRLDGLTAKAVEAGEAVVAESAALLEAATEAAAEVAVEAAEVLAEAEQAIAEGAEAVIEAAPEPELVFVGGESAPISPLVAEAGEVLEAGADAVTESVEVAAEPVVALVEQAAPKARGKKPAPEADEA